MQHKCSNCAIIHALHSNNAQQQISKANTMQAKQQALAQLQAARDALNTVDSLIASATLTLEEDGAYDGYEQTDVCGVVRDSIAELEQLLQDYVN